MDRDELLERLRRVLDDESYERAQRDIESLDLAGGESHWLAEVIEAADRLSLPEVPAVLSQDLKNITAGDDLVAPYEAHLVSDTRIHRELAGVRGGNASEGWSLSYTSEVADLVVDVSKDKSGNLAVEGQMMAHGATASAYRASVAGPQEVTAEGDRLGRFDLGTLKPGSYDLTISNGLIAVTTVLELGDPGS
jgi:hypothetical protein